MPGERGSARVGAFVGLSTNYSELRRFRKIDSELTAIVDGYAHIAENPDLKVRLVHGEQDSLVRFEHSVEFNNALAEAGYDTELVPFGGGHTLRAQLTVDEVMEVPAE